jgi:hypothetical protein
MSHDQFAAAAVAALPYLREPTEQEMAEIEQRFTYHPPKPELGQPARYAFLRGEAKHFAEGILMAVPPCRERSLALTHLQQAIMWANAGIAMEPAPQEKP